jgi:hypothetical protein
MSKGSISKKEKNPTPEKGIRKNEKEEEEVLIATVCLPKRSASSGVCLKTSNFESESAVANFLVENVHS